MGVTFFKFIFAFERFFVGLLFKFTKSEDSCLVKGKYSSVYPFSDTVFLFPA